VLRTTSKINAAKNGGEMARYVLIAMNGPTPEGSSEALEDWYEKIHLVDLKSCEGIKTARRFKTVRGVIPGKEL